jgi:hypothetical protein
LLKRCSVKAPKTPNLGGSFALDFLWRRWLYKVSLCYFNLSFHLLSIICRLSKDLDLDLGLARRERSEEREMYKYVWIEKLFLYYRTMNLI